jgi:hypothetical protein
LLSDIAANKDNFFSCLPDELLVKIFRQLSTSDLLKRVALVSTEFYRLTKSPLVHLNVDLKLTNFDEEQREKIAGFLDKAVNMRQLVVTTLDLGPLKTLSNLTSLEVKMFGADFALKSDLFPENNLPHLKSLDLEGSNLFLTRDCVCEKGFS